MQCQWGGSRLSPRVRGWVLPGKNKGAHGVKQELSVGHIRSLTNKHRRCATQLFDAVLITTGTAHLGPYFDCLKYQDVSLKSVILNLWYMYSTTGGT